VVILSEKLMREQVVLQKLNLEKLLREKEHTLKNLVFLPVLGNFFS
jgi:hypothetical protein